MGCKPAYPNLPFDSKSQLSASWTTHPSLLKASLLISHKNKGSCRPAIFQEATFLLPGHSFHKNLSLLPGLFSKSLLLVSNSFFFFLSILALWIFSFLSFSNAVCLCKSHYQGIINPTLPLFALPYPPLSEDITPYLQATAGLQTALTRKWGPFKQPSVSF